MADHQLRFLLEEAGQGSAKDVIQVAADYVEENYPHLVGDYWCSHLLREYAVGGSIAFNKSPFLYWGSDEVTKVLNERKQSNIKSLRLKYSKASS